MLTPYTWRPVPLRLRVMEHEEAYFGEDVIVLRWNAEDGSRAQRIFSLGDWDIRPAWADGVTRPAPARRPRRGLRAVRFEGYRFGTGNITLRWRAEDGTVAQRTFIGSVWHIMPDWAERGYHAAVTARPATRCDVERVRPAQSPACGVADGAVALVADMPYLDPAAEAPSRGPAQTSRPPASRVRSWFIVLATTNNWEGGDIDTTVPPVSIFTSARAGHAAFRRACKATRLAVEEETRRVEAGVAAGALTPTGGCGVLLRLYQLPRAAYRPSPDGTSPAEDLDGVATIVTDDSYSVEYGDGESFSGAESDAGAWADDVCLADYLPAPEDMPGYQNRS